MRLIANIFTRADVARESHDRMTQADRVTRRHGGDGEVEALEIGLRGTAAQWMASAPGTPADVLCVHFSGTGGEYDAWLANGPADAGPASPADGMAVSWERGPAGVLRGQVRLRGAVVADVLRVGHPTAAHDRRLLRGLGLPRGQAAVLARWAARPTLTTFSRGQTLSPELLRQIHRVLLASLERWDRLAAAATATSAA